MQQIGLEILLIFILLIINGLFSMSEIAVVSARRARLAQSTEDGNAGAGAAVEIIDSPDRFLSTVQIGITLVGILSGAVGGATLAVHLVPFIEQFAFLEAYAESVSFAAVVLFITYFSLVIGELVPKRIALNHPEGIASLVSRPMNLISTLTAPVVSILSGSTNFVLKFLGQSETPKDSVTEEEIKSMIIQGTTAGVLEETEQELMESIIRLDDQRIVAVMTPRLKIGWVNLQSPKEKIQEQIQDCPFSRLLIGDGDLDNIRGFVKAKDLLDFLLEGNSLNLEAVIKKPLFIPETATILDVLEKFQESSTHLAVIIDEFGSTQGIITTNDLLEAIMGDLPVGGFRQERVVRRADGSWLLDGRLPNLEFCETLGIKELPDNEAGKYETLAGFVIKRLERLPATGDSFTWGDHTFEVVDMDGRRVDRVLVAKLGSESS